MWNSTGTRIFNVEAVTLLRSNPHRNQNCGNYLNMALIVALCPAIHQLTKIRQSDGDTNPIFSEACIWLRDCISSIRRRLHERADAQNSTIRQAPGGIQAERPHGRTKCSRVENSARIGEARPSHNFGSDRRDLGGPGYGEVSPALRSRQHQAQELPAVCP